MRICAASRWLALALGFQPVEKLKGLARGEVVRADGVEKFESWVILCRLEGVGLFCDGRKERQGLDGAPHLNI